MSKLSRADREATGWTSIRVTAATRDELEILLNCARLKSHSMEHVRGGRQYGKRADLTFDDVVYYVASTMAELELGEAYPGERCLHCKQPHLRPPVRELARLSIEHQTAESRQFLERRGVIPPRSAPTPRNEHPHTGVSSRDRTVAELAKALKTPETRAALLKTLKKQPRSPLHR